MLPLLRVKSSPPLVMSCFHGLHGIKSSDYIMCDWNQSIYLRNI